MSHRPFDIGRRRFLQSTAAAGTFATFGSHAALAQSARQDTLDPGAGAWPQQPRHAGRGIEPDRQRPVVELLRPAAQLRGEEAAGRHAVLRPRGRLRPNWRKAGRRRPTACRAPSSCAGCDLSRRHAGHREGCEMVVRPRRDGRRLPDLPDVGGLAGEARAVRRRGRSHVSHRLRPQGQDAAVQRGRGGAVHHQLGTRQEERDRSRTRGRWPGCATTRPAAAPIASKAGSPAAKRSTPASTAGRADRCRRSAASSRATFRRRRRAAPCWSAATPTISTGFAPKDFDQLIKEGKVKVSGVPIPNCLWYVALNTSKPPFDNVKLRQAIAWAMPYEAIQVGAFFGRAVADVWRLRQGRERGMAAAVSLCDQPRQAPRR